jgi:hypothetical protein
VFGASTALRFIQDPVGVNLSLEATQEGTTRIRGDDTSIVARVSGLPTNTTGEHMPCGRQFTPVARDRHLGGPLMGFSATGVERDCLRTEWMESCFACFLTPTVPN